eukprot:COSAG02_NODE_2980_length_7625_cov_21.004651_4_plen_55_part_00
MDQACVQEAKGHQFSPADRDLVEEISRSVGRNPTDIDIDIFGFIVNEYNVITIA